jgi:triphosphoribosyl-dephospho-CoA synthase
MTALLTKSEIHNAFLEACRAELRAIKAGNVHVHAAGHDMEVAQFEAAADAAAPHISDDSLRVGQRIRLAVEASFAAAGCNTNLGIVLLCAPLAAAAEASAATVNLRTRLALILTTLDRRDAADVYAAIAHANPGGLGKVETEDVAAPPAVTLLQAMDLAKDRDRIANAYVTNYADIFDFALPCLAAARREERSEENAIASLHMSLLAEFPDSHIARKYGPHRAEEIRAAAAVIRPRVFPLTSRDARDRLLAFDASLKTERVNPGTTADFVVASLFTDTIISRGRHTAAA